MLDRFLLERYLLRAKLNQEAEEMQNIVEFEARTKCTEAPGEHRIPETNSNLYQYKFNKTGSKGIRWK